MERKITLAHGSGGQLTRELVEHVFVPKLKNDILSRLTDAAELAVSGSRLMFTTDSFVIKPLEFPGGDIGKLSVCGTVNDLAVSGARPLWISCAMIIEEGFPFERLERIVDSIARTAADAGVAVVCGDTKVVECGASGMGRPDKLGPAGGADGLFISTAGIGVPIGDYHAASIQPGDKILVSGTIGDHEAAIFRVRENLGRRMELASDCAPLHGLVERMLADAAGVRVMRDPTRGGVGAVLNELVTGTACSFTIEDDLIPIRDEVRGICELVGFDPMYLANEGKLVCFVAANQAQALLQAMRSHPLGANAAIIGEVIADSRERVYLQSRFGGSRIVTMPTGVQLPRIC